MAEFPDPRVLLDRSTPFDANKVQILDQVVQAMFGSTDNQSRDIAHKVLGEFRTMPDSWMHVATILNTSNDANTKFFALQILENTIQTRWNILPDAERNGIKSFITSLILRLAAEDIKGEKHFINKLNENLIQIVKQEWPERWPNFIHEVCASCRSNQLICENNMSILTMLSEEVFEFGTSEMQSSRVEKLRKEMTSQFEEVYNICIYVLKNYIINPSSIRESLISKTLTCVSHFLKWIPILYIFDTDFINILMENVFWSNSNNFKLHILKCLNEITLLKLPEPIGSNQPTDPYTVCVNQLRFIWNEFYDRIMNLPRQTILFNNPNHVPPQMRNYWEALYLQITIYLTSFLKNHREQIIEPFDASNNKATAEGALSYLVLLTDIPHDEIFRICVDFWFSFSETLLMESNDQMKVQNQTFGESPLLLEPKNDMQIRNISARVQAYSRVLSDVRRAMVYRMAKPQEVYIHFDTDTGEIAREYEADTAEISLYNTMRCTQVMLTNLDPEDTEKIMLNTLTSECMLAPVQGDQWNPQLLNRLCYSVGSISGAMNETRERPFVVEVIRSLLNLCEALRGKANKAVVASNIMYVVGQYPRFLRAHWKFLKTVICKLFEFMHETFPGVQDMATETFLKVAQKCKSTIASGTSEEQQSFLLCMIAGQEEQTEALNETQKLLYFEAIAHIISALSENLKAEYVGGLLQIQNAKWCEVLDAARSNPNVAFDFATAKRVVQFLRINQRVAKAVGAAYTNQLTCIYSGMMEVYGVYGQKILSEVASGGTCRIKHADVRVLQVYKRETLHLLEIYTEQAATNSTSLPVVERLVKELLKPILEDYKNNTADTRESQVLSLLAVLMERMSTSMSPTLPAIFDYVFDCTLEMIKTDFQSFPDHRERFYELLKSCNKFCFDGLFSLPSHQLKAYVESLVWAFKHEHPTVAEQGLRVTYEFLLKLIEEKRQVLRDFCALFYFSVMKEILLVLTDRLHRSGFHYQTLIFLSLLKVVEFDLVNDDSIGVTKPNVMSNLVDLLTNSFETVNRTQVETFVLDLFNYTREQNTKKFQQHMRNFLISLREFAGNNEELYAAERQEALARAQELERCKQALVPGLAAQYESFVTVKDAEDDF